MSHSGYVSLTAGHERAGGSLDCAEGCGYGAHVVAGDRVSLAVPVLFVLASCSAPLVLPTRPDTTGEACNEQNEEPVILRQDAEHPDSPVVAVFQDGTSWTLTWPEGFSATFNPLRIYDASGELIATDGTRVWLIGYGAAGVGPFHICRIWQARS